MSKKRDAVVAEQLALAGDALDSGDGAAALEALLTAWRARRAPALAQLVERLSARLPVEPLPEGGNTKTRALAWAQRAQARRAVE